MAAAPALLRKAAPAFHFKEKDSLCKSQENGMHGSRHAVSRLIINYYVWGAHEQHAYFNHIATEALMKLHPYLVCSMQQAVAEGRGGRGADGTIPW
jgi:hypothetical protein